MPIYGYECKKCKRQFEVTQGINDKPLTSCLYCFGKLRRLIQRTAFILKGSGWSQDNYSKPKGDNDEK